MSRTYVESHLDFDAIGADIAAAEPPTITTDEVLERLKSQILQAHRRGVTAKQLCARLKTHKIQVSAEALTRFIEGKGTETAKPTAKSAGRKAGAQDTPPPPSASEATLV